TRPTQWPPSRPRCDTARGAELVHKGGRMQQSDCRHARESCLSQVLFLPSPLLFASHSSTIPCTIPFSILSLFMLAFFFVFVCHFPSKRECPFARLASRCTAQLALLAAPRLPRLSVFVRSQHTPHATAPFDQRSKRTQRAVLLQRWH